MKYFKIIHFLLIICSVLIFLFGVRAFFSAGSILLCTVSFYGVVSCLYFSIMVLLPDDYLSRWRFLPDQQSPKKLPLKTYKQLIRENTGLIEELAHACQWHYEANRTDAKMLVVWVQHEEAQLILDNIKIKPIKCQISHN